MGRLERHEQGPARWLGAAQDVTEQRLTERELRAHYAVSQALCDWESFELGVVDLLRRIATALDDPMAALWLWDDGAEALGCRAFWTAPDVDPGDCEQVIRGIRFGDGEGKPGLAWRTREPVVTPDVGTDAALVLREAALERGMASVIAFPAVGPDGPVAVLSFCSFVREIEVLRLAAEGLRGPGIAEQLVLSPATVKTHFEHIYEKLGVGDRAAAVAQALRSGVVH